MYNFTKILLFLLCTSAAFGQIFGSANARRINGILICSLSDITDTQILVYNSGLNCFDNGTQTGGSGTVVIQNDGVAVGSPRAIINFLPSTNLLSWIITDTGTKTDIQGVPDTAALLTRAQNQTGGDVFCKPASASASTYTCALDTPLTAEPEGTTILFVPDVNNAAGAITINIDARGATAIKQHDGSTDPGSAALVAGRPYPLSYDGTVFRMAASSATANPPETKGLTVESPTATEDVTMWFTDAAITISQINAVLIGSETPSVTWTIRFAADRSAAGTEVVTSGTTTTSVTTGAEVTSFADATIPADNWIWLETTAQSGTVGQLAVTVKYTRD